MATTRAQHRGWCAPPAPAAIPSTAPCVTASLAGAAANAQQNAAPSDPANWPADVDKQSGFRLPLIPREQLDDEGKRRYDNAASGGNIAGLQGPSGISFYSPKTSAHLNQVSRYLRQESGITPRIREIALIITSRSMDNQFEWVAHEPEALKEGVPQDVIEVIKHRRSTAGLGLADFIQAVFLATEMDLFSSEAGM